MKDRSRPALEQGLCGPPSRGREGDDGSAAGARARLDPLLDEACCGHDDENAVNDPLSNRRAVHSRAKRVFPAPGQASMRTGPVALSTVSSARSCQRRNGAVLGATAAASLLVGDPFTNALAPVAGDAEGLQVLHRRRSTARPSDDMVAFHEVAGDVAPAVPARPILEQPGGRHLRRGEVASRVERHGTWLRRHAEITASSRLGRYGRRSAPASSYSVSWACQ